MRWLTRRQGHKTSIRIHLFKFYFLKEIVRFHGLTLECSLCFDEIKKFEEESDTFKLHFKKPHLSVS